MTPPASGHAADAFYRAIDSARQFHGHGVMLFLCSAVFCCRFRRCVRCSAPASAPFATIYRRCFLPNRHPRVRARPRRSGRRDGRTISGARDRTSAAFLAFHLAQRGISTDVCECRISWDGFRFQFGAAVVCPSCPRAPCRRKRRHSGLPVSPRWAFAVMIARQRRRIRHRGRSSS